MAPQQRKRRADPNYFVPLSVRCSVQIAPVPIWAAGLLALKVERRGRVGDRRMQCSHGFN